MGFGLWMTIGVIILTIMVVIANESVNACPEDILTCPDGTVITRDLELDCEFPECPNADLARYCTEGVSVVERAGDLVRTLTDGFIVYGLNVTDCSVSDCTEYLNLDWAMSINCTNLNYSNAFNCPQDYNTISDQHYISCEKPVQSKFIDYCQPAYKQWIVFNCPDLSVLE